MQKTKWLRNGRERTMQVVVIAVSLGCSAVLAQPETEPNPEKIAAPQTLDTIADAYQLYLIGDYERAKETYRELTRDPAKKVSAQLGEARCHLRVGKYDEVAQILQSLDAVENAEWHFQSLSRFVWKSA